MESRRCGGHRDGRQKEQICILTLRQMEGSTDEFFGVRDRRVKRLVDNRWANGEIDRRKDRQLDDYNYIFPVALADQHLPSSIFISEFSKRRPSSSGCIKEEGINFYLGNFFISITGFFWLYF